MRDARTAAELTQAELAERAGVSREWLIGLERGTRPRAELTKILEVLSALDQPITLGHEEKLEASAGVPESPRSGGTMTTAEITRRAIERSRQLGSADPFAPNAAAAATEISSTSQERLADAVPTMDFAKRLASMAPKADLASMMPNIDLSSLMRTIDLPALRRMTDLSSLMRRTDFAALMPQPSLALQGLMQELSTASTTARDDQFEEHEEHDDLTHAVDGDEDTDDPDHEGQLW